MNKRTFESREEWLNWRLGKITGSALKDVVSLRDSEPKAGVYRAAAESLIGAAAIEEGELTSAQIMQRGHDLEPVALARFEELTGKKLKKGLVGWEHPDDPRMAVSPDAEVSVREAVEVKCLLSPKHVEALYTKRIPKNTAGYEEQRLQYFIVNPKLQKLHHVFYHPAFPAPLDFFVITSTRKELAEEIARYEALEREAVGKVREIVNALSLYSPEDLAKMQAVREELLNEHRAGLDSVQAMISSKTNQA